jgi:hypothetical protein
MKCKTHPDAPHGFLRNASHSEDRYVCECEFWEPPGEKFEIVQYGGWKFWDEHGNLTEGPSDSRLMQAIKETMRDLGIFHQRSASARGES